MNIVLTGSLGHISKPLAQELVQKGHAVTVISSKLDKQVSIEALGVIAAIGTLEDVDFLSQTFTGADAVNCMEPPPSFIDPNFDIMASTAGLANNFSQAILKLGCKARGAFKQYWRVPGRRCWHACFSLRGGADFK